MAKRNVKDDLAALGKTWEDQAPIEGFFTLPDGEHEVKIINVEIGYSKNDRLQIVYELELLSGEYKGKTIKKFAGLDDDDQIGYTKGDLKKINVSIPENPEDLPETLDKEVMDLCILIQTKTTKKQDTTYNNIYFQRVLEDSEIAELDMEVTEEKPATKEKPASRKPTETAESEVTRRRRVAEPEVTDEVTYKEKTVSYKEGKKVFTGKAVAEPVDDEIDIRVGDEIWTVPLKDISIVESKEEPEVPRRRR